ncbi:MAG: bifunctional demethylmenaquinone methyltransferase/2-methoxy-6-polyprenyl-1,4-benzoquinol methylase UbiE [Planctomycetota bacterium]|nr:MAG: bifunctional demethylmenaquinone methyltransferase/2-methoxy-6-polyprenyl-1,4-benzoquinol methylase UbiE [Planctomycetota bacterium]
MSAPAVDKSGHRIRQMFGAIAGWYDFLNHFLSLGIDIWWRKKTVTTVSPKGSAPILDVCTGTGDLAIAYWYAGDQKLAVTGSDFTPQMLDKARLKGHRARTDSSTAELTFVEADTTQLPFPSDQFQIVSVAFGIRNVTDYQAGIREMIRVCQPGGRVAILEFSRPTNSLLGKLYLFYFRQILPRLGQLFSRNDQSAYNYLPASVLQFPSGPEFEQELRNCGLIEVRSCPMTFGICTLYYGEKPGKQNSANL